MNTTNEGYPELMANLPECECFTTDARATWHRCCNIGASCQTMLIAFDELAARPALEYGSQEMEWEVGRLLKGMEARVQARVQARVTETYGNARAIGLTEAKVAEMRKNGEV
jgi:hypothetical protein